MLSNVAVKFLPVVSDEKKVEVSLKEDQAVIKLSTWNEDLGWCGQKTMSFDAGMLDELHRVITAARLKLKRQNAEDAENQQEETETAKVLQFPKIS